MKPRPKCSNMAFLGLSALLVLAAALALGACGGTSGTAVSPPLSPPSVTPSGSVSASPGRAASLTWTRTVLDPGPHRDYWSLMGVLLDGGVRVAFGEWWDWPMQTLGPWAVWTSSDGLSWTRSSHLPVAKSAGITKVLPWNQELVAVGDEGSRPGPAEVGNFAFGNPVTWTSREGEVWRRSPEQDSLRYSGAGRWDYGTFANDVAAAGRYVVMCGGDWWYETGTEVNAYGVARIWTSVDGLTWQRGTIAGGARNACVAAIVTGGPVLLAVGRRWDGPMAPAVPAFWTSADGRVWRPADTSAMYDVPWAEDIDVVAGGPGFVAYGREPFSAKAPSTWGRGAGRFAVWTSRDGRSWSRAADPGFGPAAQIGGMVADGSRLLAYGQVGGVIGGTRSAAWRTDWGYAPHWGHAAAWTSSDGRHWRKVAHFPALDSGLTAASDPESKRAGNTEVLSVLRVPGGWVALGARTLSQATTESAGIAMTPPTQAERLLLWTSRDARHWTPYVSDVLVESHSPSPAVLSQGRLLVVGRDASLAKACAWSVDLPPLR